MISVVNEDDEVLIKKINLILDDFENFDKPIFNDQGDIIIKSNKIRKNKKANSVLTNIFKQIISNDIKKNRV